MANKSKKKHKHLSATELNVLSRVWRRLLQRGQHSTYALREVVDISREPCVDQDFEEYFARGAARLRRLLATNTDYFRYERGQDTVGLSERSVVLEKCLVEFVALQLQSDVVYIECGFEQYESLLPNALISHTFLIYGGSLELFFKTHQDCFIPCDNQTNVELADGFEDKSMLASKENTKLVLFCLDLLQKVGATRNKPYPVSLLRMNYLRHMGVENFFTVRYRADLDLFLLLNCRYFGTTQPEGGNVYTKQARYGVVACLKQYLQTKNAFNCSTSLTLKELAMAGRNSRSSEVQDFFVAKQPIKRLAALLKQYPNIFELTVAKGVFLRKEYCPWKDEWSAGIEMQAVRHFVTVLCDIGSPYSRKSICFDYILSCVESVPPECKDYLGKVFPGLDIIDLFHLHPDMFDLNTLNCVSLKPLPVVMPRSPLLQVEEPPLASTPAEELAACYTSRLLRYAPSLTPEVLMVYIKAAPQEIAAYFQTTSSKDYFRRVLEEARIIFIVEDSMSNHAWVPVVGNIMAAYTNDSTLASNEELPLELDGQPSSAGSSNRLSDQHNATDTVVEVIQEGAMTACPSSSESPAVQAFQQAPPEKVPLQAEPTFPQDKEMATIMQAGAPNCVCL